MAYILVEDGELLEASMSHDFSWDAQIREVDNTNDDLEDAGYDPDEVSPSRRLEFEMAGSCVYADTVDIDPDGDYEDEEFVTSIGDHIRYSDVVSALKQDAYDENGEPLYDEDDYEYNDDDDYEVDEDGAGYD